MYNRYSDIEELRPTGEASHILDKKFNEGVTANLDGNALQRVRVATPDKPTEAGGECRSCGASVPVGQTKCRFCLTNCLGDEATGTDEPADATLLGIVHLVVELITFYGAVAKGGAAANLLTSNKTEPAVDDYMLLYDLDEVPAASRPMSFTPRRGTSCVRGG